MSELTFPKNLLEWKEAILDKCIRYNYNNGRDYEFLDERMKEGQWIAWLGMFGNFPALETCGYSIGKVISVKEKEFSSERFPSFEIKVLDVSDNSEHVVSACISYLIGEPSPEWIKNYHELSGKLNYEADIRWYSDKFKSKESFSTCQSKDVDRLGMKVPIGYVKENGEYQFKA